MILKLDQLAGSFIAAYLTKNGELAWRRKRPDSGGAYSTPIVIGQPTGASRLFVPGSSWVALYDANNGEDLWSFEGLAASSFSGPIVGQGAAYLAMAAPETRPRFSAWDKDGDGYVISSEAPPSIQEAVATWGQAVGDRDGRVDEDEFLTIQRLLNSGRASVLSIDLAGSGRRDENAIRWQYHKGFPLVPSPLLYEGLIYLLKGGGILTTLDPSTGDEVKVGRLREAIDVYYASPVAGDGKIYTASEGGKVSVIEAGPEWSVLSTTDLDETIMATPALCDGRIYIRTERSLYAFGAVE